MTDAFTFGMRTWINEIIAENAIPFPSIGAISYNDEEGHTRFMPMDHTLEAQTRKSYETRN